MGVTTDDLIELYVMYIRKEYCEVVWHSSLIVELTRTIERVQKTCLRGIIGDDYESYVLRFERMKKGQQALVNQKLCFVQSQVHVWVCRS